MSKRSENFKKSQKMKKVQDLYINPFDKHKGDVAYDESTTNDIVNWFKNHISKEIKNVYDEEISKAYKNGYNAARDENEKELKESFDRGVKYGREQRENELKNKYDFVEKGRKENPVKEARDKYSMNVVYPQFKNYHVKSLEEIFEDVDKMFNQVFGFKHKKDIK